jgi:hypothetical protein
MKEADYQKKIRRLSHTRLLELWNAINAGATDGWDAGKAMEYLIIRAFELEKAEVRWPYEVELEGKVVEQIDGVVHLPWGSFLIESKDHRDEVNFEPIAKLRSQLTRRPTRAMGIVFSRSGFTREAKILANHLPPPTILLWEGVELEDALRKKSMVRGLKEKLWHFIEHGLNDYNLYTRSVP